MQPTLKEHVKPESTEDVDIDALIDQQASQPAQEDTIFGLISAGCSQLTVCCLLQGCGKIYEKVEVCFLLVMRLPCSSRTHTAHMEDCAKLSLMDPKK